MLGLTYSFLPFMILPLYASIERIDWRLVEASRDLYSTGWKSFTKVVLPLSMPGVIAGSILVFVPSLGAYVTPEILGGGRETMLGSYIVTQFLTARNWPVGASVSFVLDGRDARGDDRVLPSRGEEPVSDRAPSATPRRDARAALGTTTALVLVFLYAPIVLLDDLQLQRCPQPGQWGGFTLDWYRALGDDTRIQDAIWISVKVAHHLDRRRHACSARWRHSRSNDSRSAARRCSTPCSTCRSSSPT